ncbi:ABC transporter permease [Bradyrhizobium iriomotense]|uniref:ABC transporter permease n=1 Tax=Bradyrhizobium iriomotense TaxID=441950 RepID=A0ABQ6AVI7_9BRAD|nr:ABC transporter permease [Bradyrhizobium iriomotense]GLR84640.1 ABC transporter permease [Bradyrhizobium iriomotense]
MTSGKSHIIKDWRKRCLQILGTGLAFGVYLFLLAPSLIVTPVSFGSKYELKFPPASYSLDLYRIFFSTEAWTQPLLLSLRVALSTTVIATFIAVPAAYGLVRFNFLGKKFLLALIMSPLVIPSVVFALGIYLYFSTLRLGGTTLGLIVAHTMFVIPYALVIISAGVQKLDPNLEFGAMLMGAGRLRMLMTVVLPQLYPSIAAGALFAFLISFDEVVISWFLAGPNTTTLSVKMFSAIQWEISPVIAAVSTILTAVSLVVCLINVALQKGGEQSS